MQRMFAQFASRCANWMGDPLAFILATAACIVWAISGPIFHYSDTWQLVINTATTVLTFLAVFLIQNSQNRDAVAVQAKLDEMLRSIDEARNGLIGIERLTASEIERVRAALESERTAEGQSATEEFVEELLSEADKDDTGSGRRHHGGSQD
jgi:low affinity Fe/Cu permease